MKIWLEINRQPDDNGDPVIEKRKVKPGALFGEAEGACPGCGAVPFLVRGQGSSRHGTQDTLRANGVAHCCGDPVGYIYARPDTLFGLEEDAAVLHGRCRVY